LSLRSGSTTISASATSASDRSTCTRRKPSRSNDFSDRCSSPRCRRITWSPKSRSVREAFRAAQTATGRSSTIAVGSTSCSFASFTRLAREARWTFVASMTVVRPAASRFAAT
jgi:hypothetical protein